MPKAQLFDLAAIDLSRVIADQEAIRAINPQRGDMEHLNAIVWHHEACILGYKDVREEEFWVAGHIPGRPLLPGVLMLEAAAQLSSYHAHTWLGWDGFIGFSGLEEVRFRQAVPPGCRLHLLVKFLDVRHRRVKAAAQGCANGNCVFEATIIGTKM